MSRVLRTPVALMGVGLIAALVAVAVFAPTLATHDPGAPSPYPLALPSRRHLLGTDGSGRDLFSQLMWGARTSLSVAISVTCLSLLASVTIGVGGAYSGGLIDTVAARLIDLFVATPRIPVILIVAGLAGGSRVTVIAVIALFSWAPGARILRSQTLTVRQRGYVAAAGGLGGGPTYVVRRHLLPALGPILIALAVAVSAAAVLAEAGLAFLGLGDQAGVSWGTTLIRAQSETLLFYNPIWPWWVLPPSLAILLAIFGFALLGLALEPILNPRAAAVPATMSPASPRRRTIGADWLSRRLAQAKAARR